jgi:hypothetical protein
MKRLVLVCATVLALGSATAFAGPCNTTKSTEMRDAGSGPTPGSTGATVGANAGSGQHPPTNAMNQQAGTGPASSEDAQKQMQGQPTAAQQADGVKGPATGKSANDC